MAVHSVMVANGFFPTALSASSKGSLYLAPSADWPTGQGLDGVYALKYIGGVDIKCVQVGSNRLMIHASNGTDLLSSELSIPLASIESALAAIKNSIVRPILTRERGAAHHQVEEHQRRVFVSETVPHGRGYSPPRAPPFGTPIGPGELVGPSHPIFTGEGPEGHVRPGGLRDPRFDPLGPGYIGEPNTDHFPPPPFGEPPRGRRTPLRGPQSNIGPGGMFM